jgi:transcription-repair coupling factor (superfamily II helicase)
VGHLIGLARLRQRCRAAGIARLEAGPKGIAVEFRQPDAAWRHSTGRSAESDLRWQGERLVCRNASATPEQRLRAVDALLTRLEQPRC